MIFDRLARFLLVKKIRRSFYTWDKERLYHHQEQRLAYLTRYVSTYSAYYRQLRADGWNGEFQTLPFMSKVEMLTHYDVINTAGLHKEDLFKFAVQRERGERLGLYQGRYSVGLSSGTSGPRLPTVLSPSERWRYGSLLFARSGIPETVRRPRVLFCLRVNNPAYMEVRYLGVTIFYSDYTRPVESIVRMINEHQLNVLAGPPSLLRIIACRAQNIDHPIEGLISFAEVLDDSTRQHLVAVFQAPLAQIYQGAEGFIASTCQSGRLHLNEDVLYIEVDAAGNPADRAKRVIVTDLYRKTQPFLRYQLNDIVDISPVPCTCGSAFRVIERIHGRADDIFHLAGDSGEICYLFPDYVTRSINQASEGIQEFQAIQHRLDQIEIRLQLAPGAERPEIEKEICKNLLYWAHKAGGRFGEVQFTDTQPERNPNSQKMIRVIRRC